MRECLKLDPDDKKCFTLYKKVKKVNKYVEGLQDKVNNKQYQECSDAANKVRIANISAACRIALHTSKFS